MTTRRSFLQTVTLGAVGIATSTAAVRNPSRITQPRLRIRRNFNSLDPNGPDVAALRAGIAAMMTMDPATGLPTDRRSWGYQRGIHKYSLPFPSPLPSAWNTCTHHGSPSQAFLSWHRGYLYYFERICRAASGYDAFTLPYWNYDHASQDALPSLFQNPANGGVIPLYYSSRGINDGSAIDPIYRGEQNTISQADFDDFQGALQDAHDNTHYAVGGDMQDVHTAALDPIFYLHHCNIDRCWRHWQLDHLTNGADPFPLPAWWGTSWTFFDETGPNGATATITGQQAEHTTKLGYIYDDEFRIVPIKFIQLRPFVLNICQRYPILCQQLVLPQLPVPWPITITGPRATILPLRLPAAQVRTLHDVKRQTQTSSDRGLLELQLVVDWQEGTPSLLAEARSVGASREAGWIKAGAVSSFARGGPRDRVAIDVSRLFGQLNDDAAHHDLEWRLRFSSGRVDKGGRERPLENSAAHARILAAKLAIPQRTLDASRRGR